MFRVYENFGVGFIVKKTQGVLNNVLADETSGTSGSIFSFSMTLCCVPQEAESS